MRRGLDLNASHPLYTLEAGGQKFLVQYDLEKVSIPFVGQLGVPDPEPRIVAKTVEQLSERRAQAALIDCLAPNRRVVIQARQR